MPTSRTRRRLLILIIMGLAVAAVLAVGPLNWRTRVVVLKLTGSLDAVTWGEMARMMAPNAAYGLEGVLRSGNAFAAITSPYPEAEVLGRGQSIYGARCAVCHGAAGAGETAPSLRAGVLKHGATDWALFRTIQRGLPGTPMPAHDLPEPDLWGLVSVVKSFHNSEPAPAPEILAPAPGVTVARISNGLQAGEWLTYSGSYDGRRHSPLAQVSRANAHDLRLEWVHQMTMRYPAVETVPIVAGTTMYVTEPGGGVSALDTGTGRPLWTFQREIPGGLKVCCGVVNRGAAIRDNTLFVGTIDAHLLAIDARTGRLLWDAVVEDFSGGYSITGAPLVVGDKVIIGVGGGDFGIRGFLAAFDEATGQRAWTFYTVPGPGEPGHDTWGGESWKTGGSPTWVTGSYDPDLNLLYWGVGNPGPDYRADLRPGDNLYSNSVVALDPSTGALRWHFQFTPSDDRDWGACQIPILFDVTDDGTTRRLMGWANRNGFYYVLNRETGKFITARAYVRQNWAKEIDPNGRPVLGPGSGITEGGVLSYPARPGATNWWSPSYSPLTGLVYVPSIESGAVFSKTPATYRRGDMFLGGLVAGLKERRYSVRALDALTGEMKWEFQRQRQTSAESRRAGVLSTAGRIVMAADETVFVALDDETGKELWAMNLGGPVVAAPVTYLVGGRQRISIAAGRAIFTFGLPAAR